MSLNGSPVPAKALVLLTDLVDPAVLAVAKQGLQAFGCALCLQADGAAAAAGLSGAPTAVPSLPLVLGLCCLTRPAGAPKPVLQVRCRPASFVLRDFCVAVGRLATGGEHGSGSGGDDGATVAAALHQLVGVMAQDAACAAAGPHKTVLLLTDRTAYEPSELYASFEFCRSKGVRLELVLLDTAAEGASAVTDALAAAWREAEAVFAHVSATFVQCASRLAFSALASTLLQRYAPRPALAVSLQFKQPLLGSIRSLALSCAPELRPLPQAVAHAALCPCHGAPTNRAAGTACSITGVPLDRRQCGQDERAVQVGAGAAGALHLSAPFNIAAVAGVAGGGPATLSVLARIKVEQANPALLFGLPLMLGPAEGAGMVGGGVFKVVHEGEMVDVTTAGLLGLLCSSLRTAGEGLLASSSTDLESGAAGLLRLHYLLLPCERGAGRPTTLCAKRLASAEELLAPLLPAGEAGTAELPPAVAAAVSAQLAAVPLAEKLDPLALSSRCSEVVEMLVRESQPMPKPRPTVPSLAAAAGTTPAMSAQPVTEPAPGHQGVLPAPPPGAPAPRGRRLAAGGRLLVSSPFGRRFAIVQPMEDHSKLQVEQEGLQALRRIKGSVCPVVVIGPYRSGKSFTLNQLMGVGCDAGFGVGHTRLTQTKGVWMWGEPVEVLLPSGEKTNLVFIDTEGFESTGKADVYDDRIFALSALMSQILIYNLPESIRESDLEKLSFAVELSKAFYSAESGGTAGSGGSKSTAGAGEGGGAGGAAELPVQPGNMVWLIQRDFLKGNSLEQTLHDSLQLVPNPHSDPGITQLNRIRESLHLIAANSTAVGLPQPHLDRTRLCELGDEAFEKAYLDKRDALKQLIRAMARPKVVQGKQLDGAGLADLVQQVVEGLNERDIPTAGSLVEYFNKELVQGCRDAYVKRVEQLHLPVESEELLAVHEAARADALAKFERERFGGQLAALREGLEAAIAREHSARETANTVASSAVCERAEMACEEVLDREARQHLPSSGRFRARYDRCSQAFRRVCVGPALAHSKDRLAKAWMRESARFERDYNDRLLGGMVMLSLVAILIFRFVVRVQLGETAGWVTFVFLQVYPRTFLGDTSMYDKGWWQLLVKAWEVVVFNPVMDLERVGVPLLVLTVVAAVSRRWWLLRVQAWWRRRKLKHSPKQNTGLDRDLDV
ncbi:hypothetical protein ABPG77_011337 [Micractinium sp. CCAP 211/92]